MLTALTRKFALDDDVAFGDVASHLSLRLSGADLYALCAGALTQAIHELAQDKAKAAGCADLASLTPQENAEEEGEEEEEGAKAPGAAARIVVVCARHFEAACEELWPQPRAKRRLSCTL